MARVTGLKALTAICYTYALAFFAVCQSEEDSYDHDDDHSEHVCHYGVSEELEFALAEDGCSYMGDTNSVKFECINSTYAVIETFSGTDCDSSNYMGDTMVAEGSFDCTSTETDCNIAELTVKYYGNSTDSCDGDVLESAFYVVTDATDCAYVSSLGFYISHELTDSSFTMKFYGSNQCSSSLLEIEVEDGCQTIDLMGGTFDWTIELEDDDSGAVSLLYLNKYNLYLFVLFVLFGALSSVWINVNL